MTIQLYNFSNQKMRLGKISDWAKPSEEIIFKSIRLKPMQIAIINCNKNNHVLVNLPTGYGKSLLFQYPASQLVDKCVIVFVPLKALLWDCLKQAQLLDITASQLTPALIRKHQKDSVLPQLLFLTPERLFSMSNGVLSFVDMLYYQKKIELMVIDEAHCISEWGSDFRPDYSKLCQLRTMFPNMRLLGMSATIPPEARQDLVVRLKIPGCYYFQSSSNRTNLIYEVKTTQKLTLCSQIISYLQQRNLKDSPGIIYCQTIKSSQQIYNQLVKLNLDCCLFHSKLTQKQRSQNFDQFMNQDIKVVVATICFGMGVNKKNIRYVINVGVSLSAENYYQQSGRAGRDGEISYCLLLSYKGDVNPLEYLINKSAKKEKLKRRRIYKLSQLKDYTKATQCRKKYLFALLGEQFTPEQCKKTCDFCQGGYQTEYTEIDFTQKALSLMNELAGIKIKLTRLQFVNLLKGKEPKITDKVTREKTAIVAGIFKSENIQRIQLILDTLIQQQLLIKFHQILKGKFARKIQYLVPCNKADLKNRKAPIKLKITTVKAKELSLNVNKSFQKVQGFGKKFQSYLNKKNRSDDFSIDKAEKTQPKIETKPLLEQRTPQDENELQEIKMVEMSTNYQQFFDALFGSELQEQPVTELIDLTKEEKEEKEQREGPRQSEFETCQGEQLEHPICQPPRKQLSERQEDLTKQPNIDEDSLDEELLEMIRKKKAQFFEKKRQKKEDKAIIRTKKSVDFEFI